MFVVVVRTAVEDNMVDTPNCRNLHLDKILCSAFNFYCTDRALPFCVGNLFNSLCDHFTALYHGTGLQSHLQSKKSSNSVVPKQAKICFLLQL